MSVSYYVGVTGDHSLHCTDKVMFDANVYGEEAKITISNQVDGI